MALLLLSNENGISQVQKALEAWRGWTGPLLGSIDQQTLLHVTPTYGVM
jgi:hypothetical protein